VPRSSRKQRILELVQSNRWSTVGEREWPAIAAAVPGVRTDDLRAAGVAAEAPWGGVAQHTFEELRESLEAMTEVHGAREDLRRFCRAEVIRAKDRARAISRSTKVDEAKRRMKGEMVEWMLVWLGDPALFPAWVEVRHARMERLSSHGSADGNARANSDDPPEGW